VQQNLDAGPAKSTDKKQNQKATNAVQQGEKTAWVEEPAHPTTSDAKAQGSEHDGNAGAEAILRMLQAKQRAVHQQVSQLKQELKVLPDESTDGGKDKGRAQTQEHLSKAAARMEDFQNQMAEARYQAQMGKQKSNEAVALMDSAKHELDLAKEALDGELALSDEDKLAQKAQEMAEQLAEDADALDESVSPQEREDMLARLEAARQLLKTMPEPKWTTVNRSGRTGAGLVLTRNPKLAPAESARQMARQFWSIAIIAKKRSSQKIDNGPSDVEFYGQENKFFENAAEYNAEPVKK
jgi:hypothetical protein